jgi:hypothetical protein
LSGLRILHVNPRLIGRLSDWSGWQSQKGESWLIEHAKDLGFNSIWFSPLQTTSDIAVLRENETVSHSLYATKDHFNIDKEFSAAPDEQSDEKRAKIDTAHLHHFMNQAKAEGITVMGDLVFNHVARDHSLVSEENGRVHDILANGQNIQAIHKDGKLVGMSYEDNGQNQQMFFKFDRDPDYELSMAGTDDEKWEDVAQINYASPEALDFFVHGKDGKQGFWKDTIDWHLDKGFTGFRCDVAYKVPASVWSELVQHTQDRKPGTPFMAETLGDNGQANQLKGATVTIDGKERKAFDLAMLGLYWWNMKDIWIIDENKRMQEISRFGGAGFPDNHDTKNTVASHFLDQFNNVSDPNKREKTVASICVREYALATLLCNSVYMELGYEYSKKQTSVFRQSGFSAFDYWKKLQSERGDPSHNLNLTNRIRAINDFKETLEQAKALVHIDNISEHHNGNSMLKIECTLKGYKNNKKLGKMVLYVNESPENGPILIDKKDVEDKLDHKCVNRLVLGSGDKDKSKDSYYEVKDVAAYYTAFDQCKNNINPGVCNSPKPQSPAP